MAVMRMYPRQRFILSEPLDEAVLQCHFIATFMSIIVSGTYVLRCDVSSTKDESTLEYSHTAMPLSDKDTVRLGNETLLDIMRYYLLSFHKAYGLSNGFRGVWKYGIISL